MEQNTHTLRHSLYELLDPTARPSGLSWLNRLIIFLILAASLVAVLETEETIRSLLPSFFSYAEWFFTVIFSIEFMLRVYIAGERPEYSGFRGRVRYIFSIWSIIDLLAILPFILTLGAYNGFLLRLIRILRLLRLARIGRFTMAIEAMITAIKSRSYELTISLVTALFLLLFSGTCLYLLEAAQQPDAFGSIPRALWWSVATLTTVGYGDVTPITAGGKLFASLTAITGIGMIAIPTGILASAFSDAIQKCNTSSEEQLKRD